MRWYQVRRAILNDKEPILKIAHQYSKELGYVVAPALVSRIEKGTIFVAENSEGILGFVDYHNPQKGKNAGYNVIYHLAVRKDILKQGVGRSLLYAVPCPIRLKCTQDNDRANRFYERAGMFLNSVDQGNKRALNIWQLNILYILVRGGNKRIPEIARLSRMAYGVRHDVKAYEHPFMLDIDFTRYQLNPIETWQKYIEKVKEYRPVLAMAADYFYPEQKREMLLQIEQLRALNISRIMVCPKFDGAVKDIPDDCIVAISIPAPTYASFIPVLSELKDRQLHLLGGSPEKQIDFMAKFHGVGAKVISMDGNYHTNSIKSNQVYSGGKFLQLSSHEKVNYYDQLVFSGKNIVHHVQNNYNVMQLSLF